jgi:6-phosphogluconolactonase
MHGEIRVVDDVPTAFVDQVVEAFGSRPDEGFGVALSGGGTARSSYELLAETVGDRIDFGVVDVVWGDERCVPLDDPDSNYRLGRESLLDHVAPTRSCAPMECADVDAYDALIADQSLDLVHLGLGPDGHTASLFPQSAALTAPPGRLVVINEDPLGTNPHPRMTFTFEAIAKARLVVITVSGPTKADAIRRLVAGEDIPANRVDAEQVIWLCDSAAVADIDHAT